ncbi:hypothetical protein [uncultured Sphingomonas sp.]|uniref:hypothetical protein n=1 Tax=uncultured Sphingomonas sp. TaxID=158754 RepID=UPI0025DE2F4A|nr:hypothetical protein [uncultured Sphingomonas sp.]
MTTFRTRDGLSVLRPEFGDVMLVHRKGPHAAAVINDPGGVVSAAIRICRGKDRHRKEENKP